MSRLTFAPLHEGDLAMLREWLLRPHVAEWWGPAESIEELRRDYCPGTAGVSPAAAAPSSPGPRQPPHPAAGETPADPGQIPSPNTTRAYIAHLDGTPIAFIQAYVVMGSGGGWWEDERDPGARGTDQFLADASQLGRGLGRAMLRAFLQMTFADPAVTVVQTDPRPDNERAIRCYTRAGFRPVGRVDTPDGPALLMRCTRETLAQEIAGADR